MRVVALVSGGKDSTYNMMQCIAAGHEIVALANLVPHNKSEIDSYMYQSVGHEAIDLISQAIDLPIYKKITFGVSKKRGKTYYPCEDDEVEDLYSLLEEVKREINYEAVSVGAILSDYQRVRVENVCLRLNLTPLAYLWQRNQEELLDEMIKCEVDAIIIKVATLGLDPKKHLGRSLSLMQPHLLAMHDKYGLNVCGEGGEYETITLDCPLFKSRIVVENSILVMHQIDPIAPVGYLKFTKLKLEFKLPALDLQSRLEGLPLRDSYGHMLENNDDFYEINNTEQDSESSEQVIENEVPDNLKASLHQNPNCGVSKSGWLWLSGIQGDSTDSAEALEEAICKLKCMLESNKHSLRDICSVTMYISDMSEFGKLNEKYIKAFDHPNPPTRACVQVPLGSPVLIEALSWKNFENGGNGDGNMERHTMHVQSISHWAPCNIGPYSQATMIGDFIHVAGQIGLIPGNMQLVSGGIKPQCKLVVKHIDKLLTAIDSNVNLRDVVQGVCYVTHSSYIAPARKHWEAKTNNAIVEYVVVTGLPRSALIEWHVWAHKHNTQFEYEERGKCIDTYSISLYRRVNYENNVAAIVCRVESTHDIETFDTQIFYEALSYSIEKLKQGQENALTSVFGLKIFYSILKFSDVSAMLDIVQRFAESTCLVYSFIPVVKLKNEHTFLSICGIRNQ